MSSLADVEYHPVRVPMRMKFRRVLEREALLIRGPAGWGEFSPFPEYPPSVTHRWLAAALEAACTPWPEPRRTHIPVNVTIPAVPPPVAHDLVTRSGCSTAKVKVAEPGQSFVEDLERVRAVRRALGPDGAIRLDCNAGWTVDEATERIAQLAAFGLEYVEQPVGTVEELLELRRRVDVPIALDEVIRRAVDPMEVIESGAGDLLVLKVQPIGGVNRLLELARLSGMPVVVSSALDTSVGLAAGVAAAAALPELPYACGLATGQLLAGDVVDEPVVPVDGRVAVTRPVPSPELLDRWRADRQTASRLMRRLRDAAEMLT